MTPLPGPPPTPATNSNLVGLEEGPGVRISKPLGDSHKGRKLYGLKLKRSTDWKAHSPAAPRPSGCPGLPSSAPTLA